MPYWHARRKRVKQICKFSFSLPPIPVHKCNAVTAWFQDHQELTVIEWPSRSPDLNPIENLWGFMVNEWTDRNERTPDVLEPHYMEVWESIRRDPELCQQLMQLMRRRMQDCIDNRSRTNSPPAKTPLRQKSQSGQKPPLTKTPLQVNVLGRAHTKSTRHESTRMS